LNAENASKKRVEAELLSILFSFKFLVKKAILLRGRRGIYLAIN
jgi:hypothetical protein